MNMVELRLDELEKIVESVKSITDDGNINVKIFKYENTGIRGSIDIEIPIIIKNNDGIFRKSIVNESDW